MKDEFLQYLKRISLTDVLINRIEKIISSYLLLCPEEIVDIFVSEFIKEDGMREYESLWLFSEKYTMEAKQFIIQDDFDITPLKKRVYYIGIKKQDYDFKEITDKSRLTIDFTLEEMVQGDLKGSKENCEYLLKVFVKHILPNLIS